MSENGVLSIDERQDRLQAEFVLKQPEELEYFSDDTGSVQYNVKCENCKMDCKQSYRAVIKYCPRYKEQS